jgi:Leucine-rich repeat (LRR) protein
MLNLSTLFTQTNYPQDDLTASWQSYLLPLCTASAVIGITIGALLCRRAQQIFCPPPPLQTVDKESFNQAMTAYPVMKSIADHLSSREEALSFSSSTREMFKERFLSPHLQHFHFTTPAQVEQFLSYCQHTQETVEPVGLMRTRDDFSPIKSLSITLSDELTVEQCEPLLHYLLGVQRLEIYTSVGQSIASLSPLLQAAQPLFLKHLLIATSKGSEARVGSQDTLPDELWQLTTLEALELRDLVNVTYISEDIGKLTNLTSLHLACLPVKVLPSNLWRLEKLQTLFLYALRNLSAIPEDIGNLQALTSLEISKNEALQELPDNLWQLKSLQCLTLVELFSIRQISENIGNLQALTSLTLSSRLNVLPDNLWRLEKLQSLSLLKLYALTEISEDIGNLQALTSLELSGLTGLQSFPASMWNLKKLQSLVLNGILLSTIPEDIGKLKKLISLQLSSLPKLSTLPDELWTLNKLETLKLEALGLDTVSENIGNLTTLKTLILGGMPFRTLPMRLWQLNTLEKLFLWDMFELPSIPEQLSKLPALTRLELCNMQRMITLPKSLWQMKKLKELVLYAIPAIADGIPKDIANLQALTTLEIGQPSIKTLPKSLSRLNKLRKLYLFLPQLKALPDELSNLKKLKEIRLMGSIPIIPPALKKYVKIY